MHVITMPKVGAYRYIGQVRCWPVTRVQASLTYYPPHCVGCAWRRRVGARGQCFQGVARRRELPRIATRCNNKNNSLSRGLRCIDDCRAAQAESMSVVVVSARCRVTLVAVTRCIEARGSFVTTTSPDRPPARHIQPRSVHRAPTAAR